MFCIKTCVFTVSDTIRPVALPTDTSDTYEGETGLICGFGLTSQGKCVDPFNLYSKNKEWLLYSQCHMDLFEITKKYVIWNPTVTLFSANRVWAFCCRCIVKAVLEQVKYSGVTRTGKTVGVLVIKFKLARSEVLTAVFLIFHVVWNICCVDC